VLRRIDIPIRADTANWLVYIDDELHARIARIGLASPHRTTDNRVLMRGKMHISIIRSSDKIDSDHIIISTTYGPDPKGKFYRRFGPLGRVGGGRRLNVLVTRARDEVHIVTSIPESQYRNLPPIPAGGTPGGPWLLFSYLAEAERLAELYEESYRNTWNI